MRMLFYATFEKGFGEIVEKYIKKQDRTAHIKRIYPDSVVFFADEKFGFFNSMFLEYYTIFDCSKKEGNGAINAEMKHLLEKKNFKIYLGSDVKKIKLTFSKYSDKILIDANLRKAFETMLQKITKKQIGFFDADAELVLLAKEDGECLFMKKLTKPSDFDRLGGLFDGVSPRLAFAMNFLSGPTEKEVSLDAFCQSGIISYTRALCFKKANVIAANPDAEKIAEIKKLAKGLKDKTFSVMRYDFLSEIFPIRFIDKIVTVLPSDKKRQSDFFNKAYVLKVKKLVVLASNRDSFAYISKKFEVKEQYQVQKNKIVVLELNK